MSQLALYRKYRSQSLAEVVGQSHVVKTLESAVEKGRVSHAYLFTGPRGVGKTSVARILAKMANCEASMGQPCGKCKSCLAETHLDIIEIDAASNRSIDEMRDLRDKIHLTPSLGRYKVYIIDEVHMLTKEAFNALLKTLEEPPTHAIFILATTESHKLPATVVSRTQRFNFRPLSEKEIAAQLQMVAKSEKITIDNSAVELLARAGGGSLRDSLSLLDQIGSGSGQIDAAAVRDLLGWGDAESLDALILAMAEGKTAEALGSFDRLISQGSPAGQIMAQLTERLRELILIGAGARQATDETAAQILKFWSVAKLAELIEALIVATKSNQPALALEANIAKFSAVSSSPEPPVVAPKIQAKPVVEAKAQPEAEKKPEPAAPKPEANVKAEPKPAPRAAASDGDTELVPEEAFELIKKGNHSLYALVRTCDFMVSGNEALISCRFIFHFERLKEAKNRQLIEQALGQSLGRDIGVRIEHNPTAVPAAAAPAKNTELIASALEILGGEVIGE